MRDAFRSNSRFAWRLRLQFWQLRAIARPSFLICARLPNVIWKCLEKSAREDSAADIVVAGDEKDRHRIASIRPRTCNAGLVATTRSDI